MQQNIFLDFKLENYGDSSAAGPYCENFDPVRELACSGLRFAVVVARAKVELSLSISLLSFGACFLECLCLRRQWYEADDDGCEGG
jgi:hypothetical protein